VAIGIVGNHCPGWGQSKLPSKFTPSAVRVGTDLISIGTSIADPNMFRFEINADTDVHKYFVSFDYGYAHLNRADSGFTYQNTGTYFRLGPDVNVLSPDKDNNTVFFGIRYARGFYSDVLSINQQTKHWGNVQATLKNSGVQSQWVEFVGGVKIQLIKQLYIGFTGRYKFGLSLKGAGDLTPYDAPGFGTSNKTSAFGFNYHLFYRFQFRNKPLYVKPKKKEEPPDNDQ
jgi:hypothetical protein